MGGRGGAMTEVDGGEGVADPVNLGAGQLMAQRQGHK
jgi:hypothetical protein